MSRASSPRPCSSRSSTGPSVGLGTGAWLALLDDIVAGAFGVEDLVLSDYRRVRELCDRYAEADIGYVDAAVLAVTKRLGEPKLATLERRHFGTLRPRHVDALTLLPLDAA